MIADARLQYVSEKVDKELNNIEKSKLKETGKLENIMKNQLRTLRKMSQNKKIR